MKNEMMVFNNDELGVDLKCYLAKDGQIMVDAEEVARGIKGKYIQVKGGKEYIRYANVKGDLDKFNIPTQNGKGFIPESAMYLLVMNGDGELSQKFQKWLAFDVLPKIRKHGAYIGEDADVDYVKNELRFSKGRTIKTFASASVAEIGDLYNEFKRYVNDEYKYDTKERVARYESVEKGLHRLHDEMASDVENIGDCYNVNKLVQCVIVDKTTLQKRVSGGVKAGKTKQIARLEDELENSIAYPRSSQFTVVDCHGFSNNSQYRYAEGGTYKTYIYNKWINDFPYEQVNDQEDWEVDWEKPVEVFLTYVAKPDFDIRNFDKSILDMVITRIYGHDDNICEEVHSKRVGVCDNFADGKIGFFIRNI